MCYSHNTCLVGSSAHFPVTAGFHSSVINAHMDLRTIYGSGCQGTFQAHRHLFCFWFALHVYRFVHLYSFDGLILCMVIILVCVRAHVCEMGSHYVVFVFVLRQGVST